MADLTERVVRASLVARSKAMNKPGKHDYNLITAEAAIDMVLEEVAKLADVYRLVGPTARNFAATIRAMKGKGNG